MRRGMMVALLATMLLVAMVAPASATKPPADGADPADGHKITICHATRSLSKPYVEITIDIAAWNDPDDDKNHGDHHTRTKDGVTWKDYILQEGQECALPPPPPPPLTCDDPGAIKILFSPTAKLIGPHRNDALENPTEPGLGSVNLDAGWYDVLLGASEVRTNLTETQIHEQWRAVFSNGYTTGYSEDQLDFLPFTSNETEVGAFFFSGGSLSVIAEHWSVGNPSGVEHDPNSVIPNYVCLLKNGDSDL